MFSKVRQLAMTKVENYGQSRLILTEDTRPAVGRKKGLTGK